MNKHAILFFLSFVFTATLVLLLNSKIGTVPPLGKFMNPFSGFWQNAEGKQPALAAEVRLDSMQDKASVAFDERMVPHIFAKNENDLYMLQGYVTAQHRLWQMEFQTHAAAGRISEIVGNLALNFDRKQRRKGLGFGAENALKTMMSNDTLRLALTAYARGVNAYIHSLTPATLPLEYKLLDYKPEAWTPLKTALLLMAMADDLSGADADFEYSNALQLFGRPVLDIIYPDMPRGQDPVVNNAGKWKFQALLPADTSAAPLSFFQPRSGSKKTSPDQAETLLALSATPNPDNGSNNWAVSGTKTASGQPILCNDPHLALNLPSLWYEVQLSAPGIQTYGASLPGAPGVIVGFNRQVAWGVTNARRDVVDWYKITFKDNNCREYLLDGKWMPVTQRAEKFKVRGAFGGETQLTDTVYYTHWGPVSNDERFYAGKERINYARRWMGHTPGMELMTFYKLNRARNYQDYLQALSYYACPAQNIVFASADNNIAIWVQGKFPVRRKDEGKFVRDGAFSREGWLRYIPQPHNVHSYNPARGFVSSANQHPADTTYPYRVFDYTYEYFRNRRINRVLDSLSQITVADMQRLQTDNYNLKAAESLPFFLAQLDTNQLDAGKKEVYRLLKSWNYYCNPDLAAPVYYELWYNRTYRLLWDEFLDAEQELQTPSTAATLNILKFRPGFAMIDHAGTPEKESPGDLVRKAFLLAVDSVENWKKEGLPLSWANHKFTTLLHLARLYPFSTANVQTGGGYNIVNATSSRHGASWRMIVELDKKGPQGWGVYPGGQSGNPGSPYYMSMVETWSKGSYYPLLFLSAPQEGGEKIIFTQNFVSP